MFTLAMDTTTNVCSIALADESGIIGEYNFAHHMDLSRRLMPDIKAMLSDCGLAVKDIQAVGVSLGPGSFTGIRVGVVTAKTLAQVLKIPIVGITSLDLLAHQFDYLPDTLVCPIVKVRKGEVYHALFRTGSGTLSRLSDYAAGPVDELIYDLQQTQSDRVIFCGDALHDNLAALREGLGDRLIEGNHWLSYAKASVLAREALKRISAGNADDLFSMVPFYIRRSTPELRLEGACE